MKKILIIGGIGLIGISCSTSLMNQKIIGINNNSSEIVLNDIQDNQEFSNKYLYYETKNTDQYNIDVNNSYNEFYYNKKENIEASNLIQELTLNLNSDYYNSTFYNYGSFKSNENFNPETTTSLFNVEGDVISWDLESYLNNDEDLKFNLDVKEDSYLIDQEENEYSLKDSVTTNTPEHFYLMSDEQETDLGIIAPTSYINDVKSLIDSQSVISTNSLKVYNTDSEDRYNYEFKLNTNLQNLSAYIQDFYFIYDYEDEGQTNIANLRMDKDSLNDLFIENTDKMKLTFDENSTTIELLDVPEIIYAKVGVDYYSPSSKPTLTNFEMPDLSKNTNDPYDLYTIDEGYSYVSDEGVSIEYDEIDNRIVVDGIDYVEDANGNVLNPEDEQVFMQFSITSENTNGNLTVKMSYDEEDNLWYINTDNMDLNNISFDENSTIKINQIIVTTSNYEPLPNGQINPKEDIIDDIVFNQDISEIINQVENKDATNYVVVGILALIILLVLLIILYYIFRPSRRSYETDGVKVELE